jgi:hypothetical protein
MKKLLIILLFHSSLFAQVKGTISTKDTAKISILGVYQDQFPNISVVFRAEHINGNPVFGINKSVVNVYV